MNAIVICLDTLRWDALGCYHDWVSTPCIDHYARTATKFNAAFCGSFPTVPMRVDAYTGDVNWPRIGWVGIDEGQPKLPSLLRDAGYFTGLVLDTQNNVKAGLSDHYDEYFLIEKNVRDGFTHDDVDIPVPLSNMRQGGRGLIGDRVRTSHYRHEHDWFVARTMMRACEWLEDNFTREKFLLWVDTFEIHEDWNPPRHYIDLYSKNYKGLDYSYPNYGYTDIYQPHELARLRARYAGEVTLTDRWVGHLLRHIELLGLFANTTIILTSDHGMYIGEHKRAGKHTVDPEDPWPLYDTVARVPLLVWTPFDAPREIDALCQAADIMPTVLDVCGVKPPETVGSSWVPLLRGRTQECHGTIFTSCHSGSGPGRIDYLPSHITVTTKTHTAIFGRRPHEPELYDRGKDPGQEKNIADGNADIVECLRGELVAFMERQGADKDYIRVYAKGE